MEQLKDTIIEDDKNNFILLKCKNNFIFYNIFYFFHS